MNIEKRELLVEDLSVSEENSLTIEGYALKWSTLSNPISVDESFFYEQFSADAFNETLENDEQLILFGHDMNQILGRTNNSTALLVADEIGLHLTVELANTQLGRDTYELVKRGDIGGLSVGFIPIEDSFEKQGADIVRTITEAKLIEVSLVAMPAYNSSSVSERSVDKFAELLELEQTKKYEEEKRQRLILLSTF